MANLKFLSNVTHQGRLFSGPVIKDNIQLSEGMIVDLERDATGLKDIAQNLIDRKLATYTNDSATHTSAVVGADQHALPVDAPSGSGQVPTAQIANQREAVQPTTAPAPQAPAQPQAPATPAKQPSPEEIAAAANSVA
ncbi:MAG TPA: hypothetical protein VNG51_19395 [Ktedonobacteraceae bacterium]|nr:hypothetical protein [Ktedonobacteraceae bacterium]